MYVSLQLYVLRRRSGSGVALPAPYPAVTTHYMWPAQTSVCRAASAPREPTYTETDVYPSQNAPATLVRT